MATEEDRQEERDRLGVDPSAPNTEQREEEHPLESPADPDSAADERQQHEDGDVERQEQREAEEQGSGRGAV